jgi:hypothetical protein
VTDLAAAKKGIARVKGALDASGGGPLACYLFRGGSVTASSGGMTASAPFPWSGEALVPGKEFEAVLDRMPGDPTFAAADGVLTVRAKRFRGSVALDPALAILDHSRPDPAGAVAVTSDFLARLRAISHFINDEPQPAWTNALIVQRGRASAVGPSAATYAMTPIPDLGVDQALIPKRALALAIDGPDAPSLIALDESSATFWWPDGGWAKASLIAGNVPAVIDKLAEQAVAGATAPEITPEWREAFGRVASYAKGDVRFFADRIVAREGNAEVEDGATTPVPEGKDHSTWSVVVARVVVERATRWDPSRWPAAAPFSGELIRGLAIGRQG